MQVLDLEATRAALPWADLIRAIEAMFAGSCVMPLRHHHDVEVPGEANATFLMMPAWVPGSYIGVKVLSVFPDNHTRALPAIFGTYLLSSGKTGEMLMAVEGGELTARRTAATSALAARYLARPDSEELLIVGAGRLSVNLIQAHAAVLPLKRFRIWARRKEAADQAAEEARALGYDAIGVTDLEAAVRAADVISCCTLSSEPLVRGEWLKPGTHLDLIGAFKPTMRETDDEVVRRAEVHVDTYEGALHEGGDLVQPLKSGVINRDDIRSELAELIKGERSGRTDAAAITLFKSVGAALEDLAGAILAYERTTGRSV